MLWKADTQEIGKNPGEPEVEEGGDRGWVREKISRKKMWRNPDWEGEKGGRKLGLGESESSELDGREVWGNQA